MARRPKRYWLMKSEPDVYGIADLEAAGTGQWEGVRNYQARNFMREMAVGDRVLFYHSSCKPPGVAGVAEVVREAYPDPFQFEAGHAYFDAKSKPEDPRWSCVDVAHVETFDALVTLAALKAAPALGELPVVKKGMRLSVCPVAKDEFREVLKMAGARTRVR